jgi:nucleotide-binding universal stress UspA family protein
MGAPCRLIHAIPDVWAVDAVGIAELVVEHERRRIAAALRDVVPADALAAIEIKIGRPAHVLAESAAGAQLVVLGAKPHSALARGLGGSTAHYLVRTRDVPVLVVALDVWPPQRILAAVDLSYAAEPTIAAARRLAQSTGARLRVMHVVEPVHAARVTGVRLDYEAMYRASLEHFNRLTAGLTEIEVRDRVMRRGPAADMVAEEAAGWSADVVVVGSHGKGWIERMLVGSATESLLARLPASLLIVPVQPAQAPAPWPEQERRVRSGVTII